MPFLESIDHAIRALLHASGDARCRFTCNCGSSNSGRKGIFYSKPIAILRFQFFIVVQNRLCMLFRCLLLDVLWNTNREVTLNNEQGRKSESSVKSKVSQRNFDRTLPDHHVLGLHHTHVPPHHLRPLLVPPSARRPRRLLDYP